MMRSTIGSVFVAGMAVVLAGCAGSDDQVRNQEGNQDQAQEEARVADGDAVVRPQGTEQWMAALAAGKKLQCQFTASGPDDKTGTVKMTMERDRFRMETSAAGGAYIMVSDGKTTYSWMEGSKQGMKMDKACLEGMGKDRLTDVPNADTAPKFDTPEKTLADTPDIRCTEAEVVDFSVPSDITFTDQCAMLKKLQDLPRGVPQGLPAGIPNIPGMPSGAGR